MSAPADDVRAVKQAAEERVKAFEFERLLNQDQQDRRIVLLGRVHDQPGILLVERAAFGTEPTALAALAPTLARIQNLGANDIYSWFMATTGRSDTPPHDVKVNLIWPCTPKHIAKYTVQPVRSVTETPALYRERVRPYMQAQRDAGRLQWVLNILDGKSEQEDVILRQHADGDEGFLLLPDLNWDRSTLTSLHLLGLVARRDIWSLRDLTHAHVPWLRTMRDQLLAATTRLYPALARDQLKLYVHYQPTYYHFHVHVVHVMLEAGATQAVGKAFGLENLIGLLEALGEGRGMADLSLTYTLGEASELWAAVFGPLREEEKAGGA